MIEIIWEAIMDSAKLSIIIPHYNYPDGLKRLLCSIPYNNEIQVIVVDDCSTENIGMLEQVKQEFAGLNIEFYDNYKEKGAGNCRNVGIEKSVGDWFLFADSDDYFLDGFYETVKEYFNSKYDIVAFIPTSEYVDSGKQAHRHEYHEKYYRAYLEKPSRENMLNAMFHPRTPWSKLIRASLVRDNNIVYDNTRVANDVMFSTKVAIKANDFTVENKKIYCVTDREGSLTMSYDEETLDIRTRVFIERYKYIQENLSKKDFKSLHLSGIDFYLLALKYGRGYKKIKQLNKLFGENKVKKISGYQLIRLIRPSTLKRAKI